MSTAALSEAKEKLSKKGYLDIEIDPTLDLVEEIEKLNAADNLIFQTEKQLKEYGDKIPADKKQPIDDALAELKKAHEAKDIAAIDASMEKLNTVFQAASQEMYAAQQEAQAQGGAEAGGEAQAGADEEVTDVDFEEVKDDK